MADRVLFDRLEIYGADIKRWPDLRSEARAALLAAPDFRAAFEGARALDLKLVGEREALDQDIAASGAMARVRRRVLDRAPANVLAGMPWSRIAAAILVAAILGGAVDMVLPAAADETVEVASGDPLYDIAAEAE